MRVFVCASILFCLLVGCGAQEGPVDQADAPAAAAQDDVAPDTSTMTGHLVYVPVYSHIYYRNQQRTFNLTATLSVRNASPRQPIRILRVDYYDSNGNLVRSYIDAPQRIPPLGSQAFVVEEKDTAGGVGANFLVEWTAEADVVDPVIEAVMISTASTQGISFVTQGRPIPAE